MAVQIPEKLAERLNALMRPADGISRYAMSAGILAAIADVEDEEGRIAALAYVFANKPFADWFGPETPASEYPPVPAVGGRDRAALEEQIGAIMRDQRLWLRLQALGTQIAADEADVSERARRAWAFLNEWCATPTVKVAALAMTLGLKSSFLGLATPPTGLRYNESMPDDEYCGILWRSRAVIARLNGIGESREIKTRAALGAAVLDALSEVRDERERAIILGHFFTSQLENYLDRRGSGVSAAMLGSTLPALALPLDDLIDRLIRETVVAKKGEACPVCGEVHG